MTAPPDLLRLLAVPVFGWAALRDYRTRRVPNRTWYPPVALGAVALAWEAATLAAGTPARRRFLLAVAVSLGLVAPLGYGFYRLGGFGGADAKAFMAIAVLFPTYPLYRVGPLVFPQEIPAVGVFSLTILTDAVLVGLAYPVALAARNAAAGRLSPAMFVGRPIRWSAATGAHGKLLESPSGFTLSGLDLDALRMYLRWRGASLADLRASPDVLRDPATLPDDPTPPTDGAVEPDGRIGVSDPENPTTDGGSAGPDPPPVRRSGDGVADPWGAEAFLEDVGSAYGTTPDSLRDGLDLLVTEDAVWISPGLPFLLPLFAGMLVALVYGDVLFALLRLAGLA